MNLTRPAPHADDVIDAFEDFVRAAGATDLLDPSDHFRFFGEVSDGLLHDRGLAPTSVIARAVATIEGLFPRRFTRMDSLTLVEWVVHAIARRTA